MYLARGPLDQNTTARGSQNVSSTEPHFVPARIFNATVDVVHVYRVRVSGREFDPVLRCALSTHVRMHAFRVHTGGRRGMPEVQPHISAHTPGI